MIIEIALGVLLGGILLVILLPFLGLLISISIILALLIAILLGGAAIYSSFDWNSFYTEALGIGGVILCALGIAFLYVLIMGKFQELTAKDRKIEK